MVISELESAGLLHDNVQTPLGEGLAHLKKIPYLEGENIKWHDDHSAKLQTLTESTSSESASIIASVKNPFDKVGGLALVKGNLGRALIKVSAVSKGNHSITAPALCFSDQESLKKAYQEGALNRDFVAVIRFQGPKAMGMPELHQLTPILLAIQSKGYRVALLTDGRMSGASGAVLAAIHLVPEAIENKILRKIRDGDLIHMDAKKGILRCEVGPKELEMREIPKEPNLSESQGLGREMFEMFRSRVSDAELGASIFLF